MRALVTGGAGFAGRHLVEALLEEGHAVCAADLPGAGATPGPARLRELDVRDAAACRQLVGEESPEWVFHLAGVAHVGRAEADPERCLAVNFGGTRHMLEACLAAAPRTRFLLVSSGEVYGHVPEQKLPVTEDEPLRPATAYAVSKASAEMAGHHAAARGLDMVVLRPFNHIGPGQSDDFVAAAFARQLARIESGRQEPVLRVGNLEAVRDLTDARDTVRGYVRAAEHGRPGAIYNVTSGRPVRIRSLLDQLVSECRLPVRVEQDPSRLRPLDMPVFHGSGARLARETGFEPSLDLARSLRDVLDYWRAREADGATRER